jgi:hypothetical protein
METAAAAPIIETVLPYLTFGVMFLFVRDDFRGTGVLWLLYVLALYACRLLLLSQ